MRKKDDNPIFLIGLILINVINVYIILFYH